MEQFKSIAFLLLAILVVTIKLSNGQERPVDVIKPPASISNELDLAFVMDTTGSMGPYIDTARQNIREIVEAIVTGSNSDVRLALIEYRDHAPEDLTFVTRKNDFTSSVPTMKLWLTLARATGGGDRPEAVADALYETTKLSWRPKAAKVSVLVSDAPPHGLVPSEDISFPQGSPYGHDPMKIVRDLAQMGVTLYVIGCEPAIVPYKDFFMALAYLTGGQYVPLSVPRLLVSAITGGVEEQLSLQRIEQDVLAEMKRSFGGIGGGGGGGGGSLSKQQIASTLFQQLSKSGVKSKQILLNNKALEEPSFSAKQIAESKSMAEVRTKFKKANLPNTTRPEARLDLSFRNSGSGSGGGGSGGGGGGGSGGGGGGGGSGGGGSVGGSGSDTLRTVESGITLEQINRLVEKGASKFGV